MLWGKKKRAEKNFGEFIDAERVKNSLSLADMSKIMRTTQDFVLDILTGRKKVDVDTAKRLENVFPHISYQKWLELQDNYYSEV